MQKHLVLFTKSVAQMFLSAQDNALNLAQPTLQYILFCIAFIIVIGSGEVDVANQRQGCLILNKSNLFFKLKVPF